jgi:CARDB
MRKRGLALLLASALSLAALAGTANAATPVAKVVDCRTGKAPELRLATFEGRMKAVKGTRRMQMRFELLERTPGVEQPQAVKAPELSPWRRSRVGVDGFTYTQTVKGLSSGVTYSSRVHFRWLNAAGKVIRQEERESGTCVQDGDLPNLVLGSVKFVAGSVGGTAVYAVQVGNTGEGDAEALTVSLFADGAHIDTRTIDGLKSGEFTTVKFSGPYCKRLRAVADRGQTVPETVEEDNELRGRCPAPGRR